MEGSTLKWFRCSTRVEDKEQQRVGGEDFLGLFLMGSVQMRACCGDGGSHMVGWLGAPLEEAAPMESGSRCCGAMACHARGVGATKVVSTGADKLTAPN